MPSYTWDMNIFQSFSIWGEVCRSWEDLESLGIGQGEAVEAFLGPASPTSPNPHWPAGSKGGQTVLDSCGDVLLNLGKGLNLGFTKGFERPSDYRQLK